MYCQVCEEVFFGGGRRGLEGRKKEDLRGLLTKEGWLYSIGWRVGHLMWLDMLGMTFLGRLLVRGPVVF